MESLVQDKKIRAEKRNARTFTKGYLFINMA